MPPHETPPAPPGGDAGVSDPAAEGAYPAVRAPAPLGEQVLEIPWRRLNARMLVARPLSDLIRFIPGIAVLFLLGHTRGSDWWGLVGVGLALALGVFRWFTTTFRITPEQVQVRSGLVNRKTLTVPLDRVRTVDVTAPFLHRLLGLARVSVGTGQSDRRGDAVRLDALGALEADRLAGELLHRRREVLAEEAHEAGLPPPPEARVETPAAATGGAELARFDPAWIRFGPFTLSGLVTVFVVAGFVSRYISYLHVNYQNLPGVQAAERGAVAGGLIAIVVVAALLLVLIVLLLSTVGYVVAFWGFRLTRQSEGTLQVRRGLFTTRAITIEERRLRGVEVSEPLLLRLMRGARCIAITTGLRVGRGADRGGSMLLPPAPRELAVRVAGDVIRDSRPVAAPLRRHGGAAVRRRFTRALLVALVLWVLTLLAWRQFGFGVEFWTVAVAILPLAALLAWDRGRSLGHTVADGWLVVRIGSLIRRTSIVSCDGVIGWNLHQSFFQRRLGLVNLSATTAAGRGGYTAQDVSPAEAVATCEEAVPGLLRPFLVPSNQVSEVRTGV